MLPRWRRLTSGDDYRRAVRRGTRGGSRLVIAHMHGRSDVDGTRFGFIVTKAVGGAVARNTVRRRLKAIVAELSGDVVVGYDVVLRASPDALHAEFVTLRADVQRALKRVLRS